MFRVKSIDYNSLHSTLNSQLIKMKESLLNLKRRKLRTVLTILGITIGIFALSVMGSLSEYLTNSIDSGIRYTGDIVRVLPRGSFGIGAVQESLGQKLTTLPHVKSVTGGLETQIDSSDSNSNPFSAKTAFGINPESANDVFGKIPLQDGRLLQKDETDTTVLGHNLAAQSNLKVGDTETIKDTKLKVVGIFQPTQNNQIDDAAIVPLKIIQKATNVPGIVSFFVVTPDQPENADLVAKEVNDKYSKDFNALSPSDLKKQIQQGLLIFNIIILAGAGLAAVVGGFATINTMIMSISERTREIGIKKAIGASNRQIMQEFLLESALMGFLGGAIAVGLGKLATIAINAFTASHANGLQIFSLTPRLALLSIAFATFLGAIAGIIPAISAARMNIVSALRTE